MSTLLKRCDILLLVRSVSRIVPFLQVVVFVITDQWNNCNRSFVFRDYHCPLPLVTQKFYEESVPIVLRHSIHNRSTSSFTVFKLFPETFIEKNYILYQSFIIPIYSFLFKILWHVCLRMCILKFMLLQ